MGDAVVIEGENHRFQPDGETLEALVYVVGELRPGAVQEAARKIQAAGHGVSLSRA
jgi:hypothetical protein